MRRLWLSLSILILVLLAIEGTQAQQTVSQGSSVIPPACNDQLNQSITSPTDIPLRQFVDIPVSIRCFRELPGNPSALDPGTMKRSIGRIQTHSSNKQLSSPTGTAGTSSPVSKAATPLALLSEYGGLTESTSNQTATTWIAPGTLVNTLNNSGLVRYCSPLLVINKGCVGQGMRRALNNASLGLSFNISTASKNITASVTNGTTGGSTQQVMATSTGQTTPTFAAAAGKYVILHSPTRGSLDTTKIDFAGEALSGTVADMDLKGYFPYLQWQSCVYTELNELRTSLATLKAQPNPNTEQISSIAEQASKFFWADYAQIADILLRREPVHCSVDYMPPPNPTASTSQDTLIADLNRFVIQSDVFESQLESAILAASSTPMLTAEYDFNTPQNQPTYSTVKSIFTYSWTKKNKEGASTPPASSALTLTLNAGVSIYSTAPSSTILGSSELRDVQFGMEWDKNIPSSQWSRWISWVGDTTASATYYYQDQTSPSILKVTPGTPLPGITFTGLPSTATQVFTQKGEIHLIQAKFGLGTGTNVKFPIAVSWSNRTELIAHPAWGLQFGIAYDFSSLLGGSGSNKGSSGSQ